MNAASIWQYFAFQVKIINSESSAWPAATRFVTRKAELTRAPHECSVNLAVLCLSGENLRAKDCVLDDIRLKRSCEALQVVRFASNTLHFISYAIPVSCCQQGGTM
jgi:hypothetical protein